MSIHSHRRIDYLPRKIAQTNHKDVETNLEEDFSVSRTKKEIFELDKPVKQNKPSFVGEKDWDQVMINQNSS